MIQIINGFGAEILFPSIKRLCQFLALILNNIFCLSFLERKQLESKDFSVSLQDNYSERYQQISAHLHLRGGFLPTLLHSPPTYKWAQDYNQYMLIKL